MFKFKNVKVLFVLVICILCNNAISMELPRLRKDCFESFFVSEFRDPPFFQLVNKVGREIYVLGAFHVAPCSKLLSPATILILKGIADKGATLYTEHETTNRAALQLFQKGSNRCPSFLEKSQLCRTIHQISETDFTTIASSSIEGGFTIDSILSAQPWLFALIIGIHANSLCYREYIGFENQLQLSFSWKDVRYLETPEQAAECLEVHMKDTTEHEQNLRWIQNSMKVITHFDTVSKLADTDEIKGMLEMAHFGELMHEASGSYFLEIIRCKQSVPPSSVARNKLWAEAIFGEITGKGLPILIVVGTGHLANFGSGTSFLDHLFNAVQCPIQRLTKDGAWVSM